MDKATRDRAESWLAAHVPPGGAVIVAAMFTDKSDPQTDYFGGTFGPPTIIGVSRHARDMFAEMRKAAAGWPNTAHLGPGHDRYTVRLCWDHDSTDTAARAACYFQGEQDPYCRGEWRRSIYRHMRGVPAWNSADEHPRFDAEAAALAWVAAAPKWAGTEWRIERESYEHREKYSMGSGYYLSAGGAYRSGWRVRKERQWKNNGQEYWGSDILEAVAAGRVAIPGLPAPIVASAPAEPAETPTEAAAALPALVLLPPVEARQAEPEPAPERCFLDTAAGPFAFG